MPIYKFEATTEEGKIKKGKREAADVKQLRTMLATDGMSLISQQLVLDERQGEKLKTKELSDFCRQIGAMLTAGVPLIKTISILINGDDLSERVRNVYTDIYGSLQRGNSLSEAMQLQGGFPPLLVSAMRAAESSGQMDKTAINMAEHYEKENKLNTKIRSAMFYPIFLLCLTVVVVILIFTFILPRFFDLFKDMELPAITQFMLNMANAFKAHGVIIVAGFLILVAVVIFLFRTPPVKLWWDKIKLRIPYIGKLLKIIYTSRFARTLSSLYSSGLTIINALSNTKDTIGNTYVASQFPDLIASVRNGESLSRSIASVDGFSAKLASTINIGEESGNLDYMLTSIADSYDYESEQAMTKLTSLVEPLMIIIMAGVIGFVMVSVMLPILSLYNNIGSGYSSF